MITDLEQFVMSYNGAYRNLKRDGVTTKLNNEINKNDLHQAIEIMKRKHKSCRWTGKVKRKHRNYILIEGYYWLKYVYFQKDKKQIDADICFFETRIEQYKSVLPNETKNLFNEDISFENLENYFNRKSPSLKNALQKLRDEKIEGSEYIENDIKYVSKTGIEWLCKNCFKQKYLKLLEEYKMELTEKYIKAGYVYDNFL